MATRRKGAAKRAAGRKRTATKTAQAARKRRPPRRSRAGARATRREEAARRVERDVPATRTGGAARGHDPEQEQAPQPALAPPWAAEAQEVPGYARLVAAPQEPDADERRRAAEAELTRRREEAERERSLGNPNVPALSEIGVELALGALRLARTVATAPLRIGLAFLREG